VYLLIIMAISRIVVLDYYEWNMCYMIIICHNIFKSLNTVFSYFTVWCCKSYICENTRTLKCLWLSPGFMLQTLLKLFLRLQTQCGYKLWCYQKCTQYYFGEKALAMVVVPVGPFVQTRMHWGYMTEHGFT